MSSVSSRPSAASAAPTARRRVLLIAFHFPPFAQSSGLLRTFCFARDLLAHGWQSIVLTVRSEVYQSSRDDLIDKIPGEVAVERAKAWDTARSLSIGGRYPDWLALPDRWWSWLGGALWLAGRRWRQWRPDAIWSTYPIATAHLIALVLARISGTPWIADFRDPMVEQDEHSGAWMPANPQLRRMRLCIERACMRHAARLVFCTEGARQICLRRHGAMYEAKCVVIANGFDEEIFAEVEALLTPPAATVAPTTLVHSGVIYASPDRDPTAFIEAVGALKAAGEESVDTLRVVLRASGNDQLFAAIAARCDCLDIIHFLPALPYQDALTEMFQADGLLIFQGQPSNPAVPAKLYEYIRTGRPVLALAHAAGETAQLVRKAGLGLEADLEDRLAIEAVMRRFLAQLRAKTLRGPSREVIDSYARARRAEELAAELDTVCRS